MYSYVVKGQCDGILNVIILCSRANENYISICITRILALEKLGAVFNQVAWPLQYTPRKFVIHPESNNLIIIETDHNAYTEETKQLRKQHMAEVSI